VTYAVDWEPLPSTSPRADDDPDGLRALMTAVDSLTHEPRPATAFPLGTTGMLRLRVGRYRAVYQVDDASGTVSVMHVGRSA
jgi:mRNA interferase RelE/StbE